MKTRRRGLRAWTTLVIAGLLFAAACTSTEGVPQEDYDAVQADLVQAQADLEAAQTQVVAGGATSQQVIQTGQLAAAIEPVAIGVDGWTTEESVRGGLHLIAELDSSGDDAWDIEAHPRVYFTSESYQSNNFPRTDEGAAKLDELGLGNFIGWHVVDAYTKEVLASALYEYNGDIVRGPHGVGVSPDGKWGYVGWSEADPEGGPRLNYVGIINVRTMKLDKILQQESYFQGGMRGQALHHIQAWTDVDGNEYIILQWGFGANGGPHHILSPNDNNSVFRSITYDDVKPMGHPFTTPSPDGKYVYVSMGANWIRSAHSPTAGISKVDVQTGEVIGIQGVGWHPIGITHTQDGKWTYVIDGHSSHVFKIDNETNEVVDETSAGVAGPYGICLNWDETFAFTVGKGEGSHNIGNNVGVVDLIDYRALRRGITQQPIYLGGSASSVDHCALHPDPEVGEVWVSNMKGWETIVFDVETFEIKGYIPTPNGGDTHGMAFVWYDNGWDSGELMVDMGGPKSKTLQADILARAAAVDRG